ncbi:MAG: DUF4129 domain-containing protein [Victivallaceae bacterium]|nr:DUF4129 domain-containing protein [Victivallaceae bacterium]
MGQNKSEINSISGLDVIEEGFSLFKDTIFSALLFNLLGTIPFAIGLVYIIGDMSYGRASKVDIAGSALVLTLLWMWNNLWQAVYRTRLVDTRCLREPTRINLRSLSRIFIRQNIVQPFALFFSPLAVFPGMWWVTVFFNVFGVDYRDNPGVREQINRSKAIVGSDFKRTYLLMLVIWSFRFLIMADIIMIFIFAPVLLKMLFGIDTPFSQADSILSSLRIIFNSTFFSSVFVTAWVCYSPLEKAIWAVMIFYGESGKKGYDIIANLSMLERQRGMKIVLSSLIVFSVMFGYVSTAAAELVSPVAEQTVAPAELNDKIKQTLSKREYQWKLPVERAKTGEVKSVLGSFVEYIIEEIEAAAKWCFDLWEKIFGKKKVVESSKFGAFLGWLSANRYVLIWSVIGLSLLIIGWVVFRWWRGRIKTPAIKITEARVKEIDLTDEGNVVADDLEEDEWQDLASRLAAEGKLKLAMRAMFLAGIKALADRHLLTIARGKTNRDYRRELVRRGHSEPGKIELFNVNLGIFEKIWYGDYAIANSDFDSLSANVKQIMN